MLDETRLRQLALPLLGKWSVFIILSLDQKEMYFAEIERQLGKVSRKVLTQNLNDLIQINILYKKGKSSTGFKTYYGLTDLGKSLSPLFTKSKIGSKKMKYSSILKCKPHF